MKVMKVDENMEKLKTEELLDPDAKFIKNILVKAKSGKLFHESVVLKKDIDTICESFNSGRVIFTPINEDDVVMAYHPTIRKNGDAGVIITGQSTKDRTGEPNVTIKLSMDEFYNALSVN